jgi:hypothetical protein
MFYTGNEHICLINIENDLTINGLTFLHYGLNGNLFLDCALKQKFLFDENEIKFDKIKSDYKNYWVPEAIFENQDFCINNCLFSPRGIRGFVTEIKIKNKSDENKKIKLIRQFNLKNIFLNINSSYILNPEIKIKYSDWFKNITVTATGNGIIFSLAFGTDVPFEYKITNNKNFIMIIELELKAGENKAINLFTGIGTEDMGAISSNVYFQRIGVENIYLQYEKWLIDNTERFKNSHIERIHNLNKFFCYFFTNGITIDTCEPVAVTSRSPGYYVSGAYWDRDIFLWAFPLILDMDTKKAKEILDYGFKIQAKNFGIHSRHINGNILECGFELDELCAPFIGLGNYIRKTKDIDFLKKQYVLDALLTAEEKFNKYKHKKYYLYATELNPSDDPAVYPFNTYDNVLTWVAFKEISYLFKLLKNKNKSSYFNKIANMVCRDIKKFAFLKDEKIIVYEFDTYGNYRLYEEPAGSLKLLNFYGFIQKNNVYYRNTLKWIYSEKNEFFFGSSLLKETGCAHAKYPWVLSAANSLFTPGYEKFGSNFLKNSKMDDFIVCESVDANTGEVKTGKSFATASGFVAFAIKKNKKLL